MLIGLINPIGAFVREIGSNYHFEIANKMAIPRHFPQGYNFKVKRITDAEISAVVVVEGLQRLRLVCK